METTSRPSQQPVTAGGRGAPLLPGPGFALLLSLWTAGTLAMWWLAFYEPSSPPEWLNSLRAVCFGISQSPWPDTSGWITLAGAPLTLLAAMAVVWPDDLLRLPAAAWGHRWFRATTLLILGCFVLTGVMVNRTLSRGETTLPAPATTVQTVRQGLPPFELVDQAGAAFTRDSLDQGFTLLTFAYAHCETVCPVLVQTAMAAAGDRRQWRVVVITLDPRRDTPSPLPGLAKAWNLHTSDRVLSGQVAGVEQLLERLEVPAVRDARTGMIAHPPVLLVVSSGQIVRRIYNPTVAALQSALAQLPPQGDQG